MKTDPAPAANPIPMPNTIKSERFDPNLTSPPPLTTQTPPAQKETAAKGQKRRGRPPGLTKVTLNLGHFLNNFCLIGQIS